MEQPNKRVIKKLNALYIQTRRKYLVQFPEGRYITLHYSENNNVTIFNDSMLRTHLKGELTYGVFSGGYFSKFITFDVDCENESMSRWVALRLVYVLFEEYGIDRRDIHVSTSGGKGYHVDLFFDEQIKVEELRKFYQSVIISVGELPEGKIEFRPSWKQGVKLPLGIHQRTGNRCWYVDNETLEPIESYDYILDIEPIPAAIITESSIDLTEEQKAEFERIATSTDITVNAIDMSQALKNAAKIIETGRLTQSGTRHKTTYTLALFGNTQGWEREETVEVIMDVLLNTPREYFSEGSTPEYWLKEARRLVDYVFNNDLTIKGTDKDITIYKSEILAVLNAGTFRQKQLAYAMLVTSKRFGNIFYLTINTAMKMIGTNSRQTVQKGIEHLIEIGFIKYHRKAEVDEAKSREVGHKYYKPSKFRLAIPKPDENEESVTVAKDKEMIEVVIMLCDENEIRKHVKRYEFENRWKRHIV